jgi:hypothetical protein
VKQRKPGQLTTLWQSGINSRKNYTVIHLAFKMGIIKAINKAESVIFAARQNGGMIGEELTFSFLISHF